MLLTCPPGDDLDLVENLLVAELNSVANAKPKVLSTSYGPSDTHYLDDLLIQFTNRAKQWKDDWKELLECKEREQSLRATTSEQASRITVLEQALYETEQLGSFNGASGVAPKVRAPSNLDGAMNPLEAFYRREIAELNEQNEELQEITKSQEQDVQNTVYLQERNQLLEQQLAEKTSTKGTIYDIPKAVTRARHSTKSAMQFLQNKPQLVCPTSILLKIYIIHSELYRLHNYSMLLLERAGIHEKQAATDALGSASKRHAGTNLYKSPYNC